MSIDHDQTLADLVLERPWAAAVLERLQLDYCCGGERSLTEACRDRGVDPTTVAALLEEGDAPVAVESRDWVSAPVAELCAHIVDEHHARLRRELPRLGELVVRVAAVHGERQPQLHELRDEFAQLRADLEVHIDEEERELFPLLVDGGTAEPARLEGLLHEHGNVGVRLRRLRELADGYAIGSAHCSTHQALYRGLHDLELDLHQHVHEENNILFPRLHAAAA